MNKICLVLIIIAVISISQALSPKITISNPSLAKNIASKISGTPSSTNSSISHGMSNINLGSISKNYGIYGNNSSTNPKPIKSQPSQAIPTSTQVASYLQNNVVPFLTNVPAGHTHYVDFTASTITQNGLVSYISSASSLNGNSHGLAYDKNSGTLTGSGVQFFSDRMYSNQPGSFATNPFDPSKTDRIVLTLNPNDGSGRITLLSWGNTVRYIGSPAFNNQTNSITGIYYPSNDATFIVISFQYRDVTNPQ